MTGQSCYVTVQYFVKTNACKSANIASWGWVNCADSSWKWDGDDYPVGADQERQRTELLQRAVQDVTRGLEIGLKMYEQGVIDYQRVLDSQRALVVQDDALAQSRGKVSLNLVAVYKALGGGWHTRLPSDLSPLAAPLAAPPPDEADPAETVPLPHQIDLPPTIPAP